jgi:FlaA1/EpsC-like NDP-sugar epimerase
MKWLDASAAQVLSIPRSAKRLIALAVDALLCVLAVWVAYYLRLDEWIRLSEDGLFKPYRAVLASWVLALPIFITHGFYRVIFRYSDLSAAITLVKAFLLYGVLYALLVTIIGIGGIPRSVGIIQPMLLLIAVGSTRALIRYWLGGHYQGIFTRMRRPKMVIYGAGNSGRQLATSLANNAEMQVIAFLDDDPSLQGQLINDLPIYSPAALPQLVQENAVRTVLLAMPSLSRQRRNAILEALGNTRVAVRTLPRLNDVVQGRVNAAELHELDIDDLLGREPVQPNPDLLQQNICNKVVMVTGAGGSIGSELCRQIAALQPRMLLLVEQSEYALYAIHEELQAQDAELALVPLLVSVQDAARMQELLAAYRPDTIYHAAAYKHVPLVESNWVAGIRNNLFGTLCVAQAALQHGVQDMVLISTDKAVRPTNVMGASKRLAEMALQALAAQHPQHTRFSMVRFW